MSWHPTINDLTELSALDTTDKPNNIGYYVASENSWYFLDKTSSNTANPPVVVESDTPSSFWIQSNPQFENQNANIQPLHFTRLDSIFNGDGFSDIEFLLDTAKSLFVWDGTGLNQNQQHEIFTNFFNRFPFKHCDKYNKSIFIADSLQSGMNYQFTIKNNTGNNWLKENEKLNVWLVSKSQFINFAVFFMTNKITRLQTEAIIEQELIEKIREELLYDGDETNVYPPVWQSISIDASILELLKVFAEITKFKFRHRQNFPLIESNHRKIEFDIPFNFSLTDDDCVIIVETVFQQSGSLSNSFRAYLPCVVSDIEDNAVELSVSDSDGSLFNFLNNLQKISVPLYIDFNWTDPWEFVDIMDLDNHPWQMGGINENLPGIYS